MIECKPRNNKLAKPARTDAQVFSAGVGRALRRAAKTARKTARNHGTPIVIERDGKIVTLKP